VHDLKFIEASNICGIKVSDGDFASPACMRAARAFEQNAAMVISMIGLPGFSFMVAGKWIVSSMEARDQIVGSAATHEQTIEHSNEIGALAELLMRQKMQVPAQEQPRERTITTQTLMRFVGYSGPYIQGSFQNLLNSVIILSWSAFEVLVEDLLLESIKEHPTSFSHVLKPEKLRFRSRDYIRKSYAIAFPNNDAAIIATLNNQSVDALALVRNLLIHKGGIVDDTFLKDSVGVSGLSGFASLLPGAAIQIDGLLVISVVDPVIKCGYQLLKAVDDWIKSHP